ncbi:uncharacterized protein LOC126882441 [Diabrotica virgifera virgifera]|uniref:NADH dehydrogenase [ubiquinone] flavoprotein 3, mitochondrial n=1 Tax=Diabrotica virgifera virgifera TaxID=50390 RepID=A0ABM5JZJ4_DIAVI|nr:uncharacterized protein LOC126882441 [Diabrotica virgifera virgifera]
MKIRKVPNLCTYYFTDQKVLAGTKRFSQDTSSTPTITEKLQTHTKKDNKFEVSSSEIKEDTKKENKSEFSSSYGQKHNLVVFKQLPLHHYDKLDSGKGRKDPLEHVTGLSEKVFKVPDEPVGPGAAKNAIYKNPEYFCTHKYSFYNAKLELAKYRLPQPSTKVPYFHELCPIKK